MAGFPQSNIDWSKYMNSLESRANVDLSNLSDVGNSKLSSGGSGSSGTSNYTDLTNKPQINSVELSGNKTLKDLGIQPEGNYADSAQVTGQLNKKLESSNIIQGSNITLSKSGNNITISSTGGSGGISDYTGLTSKPQINSVELSGNKTLEDLGIQPKGEYIDNSQLVIGLAPKLELYNLIGGSNIFLNKDEKSNNVTISAQYVDPPNPTYSELSDKPSINGVTLEGDLLLADIGMVYSLPSDGDGVLIDVPVYSFPSSHAVASYCSSFVTRYVNRVIGDTEERLKKL